MSFGVKIRRIRQTKNWSQQEVANKLNVSQSAYHLWESDQARPSVENLFRLSNLFEIDIYELLQNLSNINSSNIKFEQNSYLPTPRSTEQPNYYDRLDNILQVQKQIMSLIEKQNQLLSGLKGT